MAEAYLKSKNIPNLEISSSGIHANRDKNGTVAGYTITILKNHHISEYLSPTWQQTTKELLEGQDLVIFMHKNHEAFCLNELHANVPKYITWDIPDIPDSLKVSEHLLEINERAEKDFQKIKDNIDKLNLV
jgi:protein-tyrosine-phosphatase